MLSNVLVCFTYFGSGRGNFVLCFSAYTMKLSCIPSVVKLLSSLLLASIVQKVDNVIYRINFCSVNNAISFPLNLSVVDSARQRLARKLFSSVVLNSM